MCFVCKRLGLSDDINEGWRPEHRHDEEEGADVSQPQRPRRQTARRSPRRATVVEPAPSHDNAPAFASYSVLEGTVPADFMKQRALYGLCIYDVTPDANPSRAKQMACSIFERTMTYRRIPDGEADRIEVVALPLPRVTEPSRSTERKLAEYCMRYFEKEKASRMVMEDAEVARSWYLPELLDDTEYTLGILVISRLTDIWEEGLDWKDRHPGEDSLEIYTREKAHNSPFGTGLLVKWQPREWIWQEYEGPMAPESQVRVNACCLEELREAALELNGSGARTFREHFAPDGILGLELAAARSRGS